MTRCVSYGKCLSLVFAGVRFLVAGVAQLEEQLTCNQQVAGSSPIASSIHANLRVKKCNLERFPSGQREQTVNLSAAPSEVQILPSPPFPTASVNLSKMFNTMP